MASSASTTNNEPAACVSRDPNSFASLPKCCLDDEDILDDIDGHIHGSVKGFFEKYFENKSWSAAVEQIVQTVNPTFNDGRWTDCPQFQTHSGFLEWLGRFQTDFFKDQGTQARYLEVPFCNSIQGLVLSLSSNGEKEDSWANVQVIGELCQDMPSIYKAGLLHLSGQAQEVFASQPTRQFLHGFYIFADILELWVFDRSGLYSCEPFDISKRPDRFLTVMAGYLLMSDEERGVSRLINGDEYGKYIWCRSDDGGDTEKLYLDHEPIAFRRNKHLVSDGLTCYRARRSASSAWEFVVKLKWRSAEGPSEIKILDLIKERKVWGVIKPFSYQVFDSIENIRRGLVFGPRLKFLSKQSTSLDTIESNSTYTSSIDPSKVDKNDEKHISREMSTGVCTKGIIKHTVEKQPTYRPNKPSKGNAPFENRILSYTVVSPIGRELDTFETTSELLEVFRDCIKAHRSLYQVGKILHQDISEGNILIVSSKEPGDPKGILIDMDIARECKTPSKKNQVIGTTPFISIGSLIGSTGHTYRHDLESFFYVFLWVVIHNRAEDLPKTSRLQGWRRIESTCFQLGQKKLKDMETEQFEGILSEFPPALKTLRGLAKNLHQILFPRRNGELWIGTDTTTEGTNELYVNMIHAFDVAIASGREPSPPTGIPSADKDRNLLPSPLPATSRRTSHVRGRSQAIADHKRAIARLQMELARHHKSLALLYTDEGNAADQNSYEEFSNDLDA